MVSPSGVDLHLPNDLFFGAPKSLQMVTAAILKDAYSLEGKL